MLMAPAMDVEELIARPLDVIARLRLELRASGPSTSDDESALLGAAISEALCSGDSPALGLVPVLSRESLVKGKLAANSMVRYRGMVQDQYEPEYFVGSFEEVETATGKRCRADVQYVDSIAQRPGFVNDYDGPGAKTMDRLPLFCVPVPGLSQWAMPQDQDGKQRQEVETRSAAEGGLPKRQREGGERGRGQDAMDCTDENGRTHSMSGEEDDKPKPKTLRSAADPPVPGERAGVGAANGNSSNSAEASPSNGMSSAAAFHHEQELDLAGLACVVKLYDFREGQVKLNDTAEFVGVLGYDQEATPSQEDEDVPMAGGGQGEATEEQQVSAVAAAGNPFRGLDEFSRKIPPPSLAPRLHCIFHRRLPVCAHLTVDPKQPRDALRALQGPLPFGAFMRNAKQQAIRHLAKALRGDVLATEYVLLALLSRAYVRTESLAPGSLSLNLRGVSPDETPGFHAAISDLVPKCVTVPITTKSLSEKFKFSPKKDYEAERLMLSSLQLSDGTVVILDETRLEPGQVGTEGVGNLAALNSLMSVQKIPYDFGFYKMEFEVDHPTISLSLRRSVIPAGVTVPVVAAGGAGAVTPAFSDEDVGGGISAVPEEEAALVLTLRVYLEATRRTELSLDETSSALAEEDFVKARQQGQEVTGEDFHRMLTVARLTALSLGDATMTAAHWGHMKELEAKVAERVQQQQQASRAASTCIDAAGMVGATPISPSSQAGPLNAIPENE